MLPSDVEPPPLSDEQRAPKPPFRRRAAAALVDVALLALVGVGLCAVFFEPLLRIGDWGRIIGFAIALTYSVACDARGGTPGKKLLRLRVVGPDGTVPGLRRALVRNLILVGPWFLIDLWLPWPGAIRAVTAALPWALYLGVALTVVFDAGHVGLHDRLSNTAVVSLDSTGLPTPSAATWRTALLVLAPLLATPLSLLGQDSASMLPLMRVMNSVQAMPSQPLVQVNDNTFHKDGGSVRTLIVAATFAGAADEAPGFAGEVARRVLESGADLSRYDGLRVVVRRLASIRIGYFAQTHIETRTVAQWRAGGALSPASVLPRLAPEGPVSWSIAGKVYEVRSWYLEFKNKDGSRGLYYLVEWNCPECQPRTISEARANELTKPIFALVCAEKKWQRAPLSTDGVALPVAGLAVQIVDRNAGTVYPHFGVSKRVDDACGAAPDAR